MAANSSTSGSKAPRAGSPWPKRLVAVMAFLGLVVVGDRLLGKAASTLIESSEFRFSRLYRGAIDAEVLIMGDSRAVATMPPLLISKHTGKHAFSIAYNGLAPGINEVLLEDYLERNPKPTLIVLEVSSVGSRVGATTDFKVYSGLSSRLRSFLGRQSKHQALAARISHLFRVNSEFLLRAMFYRGRSDQGWMNHGRITATKMAALEEIPTDPLTISPSHLQALKRLIKIARHNQIELRLFVAPYLDQTRDRFEVEAWLRELRGNLGHPIDDYSSSLSSESYFADRIHTNELGADELLNQLTAAGFFDHTETQPVNSGSEL